MSGEEEGSICYEIEWHKQTSGRIIYKKKYIREIQRERESKRDDQPTEADLILFVYCRVRTLHVSLCSLSNKTLNIKNIVFGKSPLKEREIQFLFFFCFVVNEKNTFELCPFGLRSDIKLSISKRELCRLVQFNV